MTKKRFFISISIVVIFLAVGAGIFFGFKKFGSVKKVSISPSIADIPKSDNTQQPTDQISDSQQDGDDQQLSKASDIPLAADKKNDASTSEVVTPDTSKTTQTPATDVTKPAASIVSNLVSWGFQKSSGRTIKAVIVHTSYNALGGDVFDFDKVMQEWKDAGVSPHYAIDRSGTIYQLVADQNIAWHAGSSKLPDGTTDVNGTSIGIEVVNDQNSKFTDAQYISLNRLIGDLKKKYSIKYVLGHDDIAPGRKTDPWGIEWSKVQK